MLPTMLRTPVFASDSGIVRFTAIFVAVGLVAASTIREFPSVVRGVWIHSVVGWDRRGRCGDHTFRISPLLTQDKRYSA